MTIIKYAMKFRETTFTMLFLSFLWNTHAQELQKDVDSGISYLVKKGQPEGPLVIMIHGYGSNEKDLYSLHQYFGADANYICPRGIFQYGRKQSAFTWYAIKFKNNGNHERNSEQAHQSDSLLRKFATNMKSKYGSKSSKVIFGGFSQGAIMSLKIAIAHPEVVDGIVCLSGAPIVQKMAHDPSKANQYKRIKAFYAHGSIDQILPISYGRLCKKIILNAGMSLEYHEYSIKHTISGEEMAAVKTWFEKHF